MKKIDQFKGRYFFLSNFYPCDIYIDIDGEELHFKSSEAYYQGMKCPERIKEFEDLDPDQAKQLGKKVKLREDWEEIKDSIMLAVVYRKFSKIPELKEQLLATGDMYLEEGNNWNDRYWGTVNGKGKNQLGRTLMQVRDVLRNENED